MNEFSINTHKSLMSYPTITFDKAIEIRDKVFLRYGIIKRLETEFQNLVEDFSEEKEILNQIYITLNKHYFKNELPIQIEEAISKTFSSYVFNKLVDVETKYYLKNKTKRMELRFPIALLKEVDEYQEKNHLSNRSATIFELCRIALSQSR